ncbi:TraR/DksA family transcriptional regulator [Geobacter benzoatilyticus]|jgi:DnaK suppressor protein|uniref:TraR/DksA family transcriptional regulator n=1 Tax=Geobacter benzoatilyticus TaxID=2815309 RepID=A0ABX7Q479_9BACT|nr:TraR/DksA family transcriptional regulator [Geobacter benzoatilyticus]QSV45706.1 TraR/DksA family transcriptional regulator [Geobacter benzoatilyticus]
MERMSGERKARLTEVLLAEKRRLWSEVRRELFDTVGEELRSQYDIPQDVGDRGLIDTLEDTGMAVADIRRQELTRMDEALGRLEEGRYGFCVECGAEISEERLRVAPYAPCCVSCQTRREGPPSGPGVTL